MSGVGAGELKLALQIGEGDVDVAHGHIRIGMSEQLHQDREADSGAKHLRSVGVPELVGNDGCGQTEGRANLMQVIAQLVDEGVLAAGPREEALIGSLRIERAKETQTMHEVAYEGIDGNHAFGLELAEGHKNGPRIWSWGAKAIEGQIGTLADAHAGVAHQKKDICASVVATTELLLQELILLGSKRPWESLWSARNILAANEASEFEALMGASQFVEHTTEKDEAADTRGGRQGWSMGTHVGHPAEDMVAMKQLEAVDLRVMGSEISEELPHRSVVSANASRSQCGTERIDRAGNDGKQRMLEQ